MPTGWHRRRNCCCQASPISNYLVDLEELKSRFRENFLRGLQRLHARGKLKLNEDWKFPCEKAAFDDWLKPLEAITWLAYIEPPPNETCRPERVAKYLARYLTGGPISDRRIVSHENGFVTSLARVGKTTGGNDRGSSCTVLFVRTGIEMTEAPHDNAVQRELVGHHPAARTTSCCASHWNASNSRPHFARRVPIELLPSTHNHCVRLDRHDHTGENPGDKLSATG